MTNSGAAHINVSGDWIFYCKDAVYGLYKIKTDGSSDTQVSNSIITQAYVVNDYIYYIKDSDGGKIYRMKNDGTKDTPLTDVRVNSFVISGDMIYYVSAYDNMLYRIEQGKTNGTRLSISDKIKEFNISGDWVYYSNRLDNNKLYKCKTDGSGRIKMSDISSGNINIAGNTVFYKDINSKELKFYRIKPDGTDNSLVN